MNLLDSALIIDFLKADASSKGTYKPSVSNIAIKKAQGELLITYQYNDYHGRYGVHEVTTSELELITFAYDTLTNQIQDLGPVDESSKYY